MRFIRRFQAWWYRVRGYDKCNKCASTLQEEWDYYCVTCNSFPHKKWLNEEECLWLDFEDFRRNQPDEYADWDLHNRKRTVLRCWGRLSREELSSCFGEDAVLEELIIGPLPDEYFDNDPRRGKSC